MTCDLSELTGSFSGSRQWRGEEEIRSQAVEEDQTSETNSSGFFFDQIGAEVECGEEEQQHQLMMEELCRNDVVPQTTPSSALLEVPSAKTELYRRCSYEEIIHTEEEAPLGADEDVAMLDVDGGFDQASPPSRKCLVMLTQWALTLQEVYEDRENSTLKPESTKCLCHRADRMAEEMKALETCFIGVIEAADRLGHRAGVKQQDLSESMAKMRETLRSHVSISISNPSLVVRQQSNFLVQEMVNIRNYVRDAVEGLIQLIHDLMNVHSCKRHVLSGHRILGLETEPEENLRTDLLMSAVPVSSGVMERQEEEDIRRAVAKMCNVGEEDFEDENEEDYDDNEDGDEEGSRSPRKRKQNSKNKSPPTSPTSSPSKRARKVRPHHGVSSLPATPAAPNAGIPCAAYRPSVIELLERNKKMVKNNGLYQFVLWREALKAEKDRVSLSPTPGLMLNGGGGCAARPPPPSMGAKGRRLSFH